MTNKVDLLNLGREIVNQIHQEITKISMEERGILIRERDGDQTKKIDKVADDTVYRQLKIASETYDLTFLLLSEEQGKELIEIGTGSRKVYGITDPVDGSWNATTNIPFYSSNLAFTEPTEKDKITLEDFDFGVIGDLVSRKIYFARRKNKAYQDDGIVNEVFTSKETDPKKSRIILDSYTAKDRKLCENMFQALRLSFKDHGRYYGAGIELVTLLAPSWITPGYVGHLSRDQKIDNIIAGKIIIESAGGIVSDWNGNPLSNYELDSKPHVIFSANQEIHKHILNLLR